MEEETECLNSETITSDKLERKTTYICKPCCSCDTIICIMIVFMSISIFCTYIYIVISTLDSKTYEIDKTLIHCNSDSIIHVSNCSDICKFSLNYLHESCDKCYNRKIQRREVEIYMKVLKDSLPVSYNYSLNECHNINSQYYDSLHVIILFIILLVWCFIYYLCKDC